jgi:hypothetical protein
MPRLASAVDLAARRAGIGPLSSDEINRVGASFLVDALASGSAFERGLQRGEIMAQLRSVGYDGSSLAAALDRLNAAGQDAGAVWEALQRTPPADLRSILADAQQNYTKILFSTEFEEQAALRVIGALSGEPYVLLRFAFWNHDGFPISNTRVSAAFFDAVSALDPRRMDKPTLCALHELISAATNPAADPAAAAAEDEIRSEMGSVFLPRMTPMTALATVPPSLARERCSTDDRGGEIALGNFSAENLKRLASLAYGGASPELPTGAVPVEETCSLAHFRDLARDVSNGYSPNDLYFSSSGGENCPMSIWLIRDKPPKRRKKAAASPVGVTVKIWIGNIYAPPTMVVVSDENRVRQILQNLQTFTFSPTNGGR